MLNMKSGAKSNPFRPFALPKRLLSSLASCLEAFQLHDIGSVLGDVSALLHIRAYRAARQTFPL
jgi:hypothetical protein